MLCVVHSQGHLDGIGSQVVHHVTHACEPDVPCRMNGGEGYESFNSNPQGDDA
jgi:hypothetical protein